MSGLGAGAQSAGELAADVDLHVGVAQRELLEVGVDGDELDLGEAGVDHPVDGVQTCAADAHYADDRLVGRIGRAARGAVAAAAPASARAGG